MNADEQTKSDEDRNPGRFRGRIGIGHIPTLGSALGLWWMILTLLPL